jgi:hypothetical protein
VRVNADANAAGTATVVSTKHARSVVRNIQSVRASTATATATPAASKIVR